MHSILENVAVFFGTPFIWLDIELSLVNARISVRSAFVCGTRKWKMNIDNLIVNLSVLHLVIDKLVHQLIDMLQV